MMPSIFALLLAGQTELVAIPAIADATLIQDPVGALANGAGPAFFAGRTSQTENGVRRALLAFDVASAIPAGAVVLEASVVLHCSPSNPQPTTVSLHRVLAPWTEGPSASSGGQGVPAVDGDVTWTHASHLEDAWPKPGGHCVPVASAAQSVGDAGSYTWPANQRLVHDVRLWLKQPALNHGWLIRGDEQTPTTVKRFESSESPKAAQRPTLLVVYSMPN
jgi:hypothetical protein